MAKFEFKGIDEYLKQLEQISDKRIGLCKRAVYDGAAVVLHAVESEVNGLQTTDRNPKKGEKLTVLSYEKQGLQESLGVAKIEDRDGYINTKVWFDGYNRLKSKKYPQGHPNMMVARAINSGTSQRVKNPFMFRAARASKNKCIEAMRVRFDKDIEQLLR